MDDEAERSYVAGIDPIRVVLSPLQQLEQEYSRYPDEALHFTILAVVNVLSARDTARLIERQMVEVSDAAPSA